MASIVRVGLWTGAAPTFTGASDSAVSAEAGTLRFNREDTLAGTTGTVPIPAATGTSYSWLKNLGLDVTTPAPTTISNRRISVVAAASDVQTVAATGGTAGTFTLTFNGQTTAAINWNDTAALIQSKLQALSTIGAGNVTCTGGPLNTTPVVCTFAGTLANMPQAVMTVTGTLTGATPTVAHTTTGVQALGGTTGLDLHWKGLASASYAQAAAGNMPAAAGTNDATPAGYTKITTTAAVWDAAAVSANTQGLNGLLLVMTFGVDAQYVSPPGQALNAVNLPNLAVLFDEA